MKRIISYIVIIAVIVMLNPVFRQDNVQADHSDNLLGIKIIRFASIFGSLPGINTEDARFCLEIIMRKTMAHPDHPFRVELDYLSDYSTAATSIARGGYHFIALTGLDYADLRRNTPLSPMLVLSKVEKPTEPLVLLTRENETLESIGRKSNSILMLESDRVGVMSRMWMDTVLWEQGFESSISHFSEVRYLQKVSRIILPVFFGKADACVVTLSAFDIMADLNPQITQQLKMKKQSEGLVFMLVCSTPLTNVEDEAIMQKEAAASLEDPYTRQALTIAQMKNFFPSKPEYMTATEALFERYRRMAARYDPLSATNGKMEQNP